MTAHQPIPPPLPARAAREATAARRRLRVLIVDDHPAVRVGLQGLLDAEPDLSSVAAVATARGALAEAERLTPDVAVVDYQLGDRDGLTLARQLKNLARPPRVLIYSAYADAPMTVAAVIAGADGIASKGGRGDDLCLAIRAVGAGRPALPTILPDALRAMAGRLDAGDVPILAMLVHGTPADEIADVLGITHDWLDARRWSILKRLTASPRLTRLRRPPPPQRTGR